MRPRRFCKWWLKLSSAVFSRPLVGFPILALFVHPNVDNMRIRTVVAYPQEPFCCEIWSAMGQSRTSPLQPSLTVPSITAIVLVGTEYIWCLWALVLTAQATHHHHFCHFLANCTVVPWLQVWPTQNVSFGLMKFTRRAVFYAIKTYRRCVFYMSGFQSVVFAYKEVRMSTLASL